MNKNRLSIKKRVLISLAVILVVAVGLVLFVFQDGRARFGFVFIPVHVKDVGISESIPARPRAS